MSREYNNLTLTGTSNNLIFNNTAGNDLTFNASTQTGDATLSVPDLSGTSQDIVGTSATQTLTNKTLSGPVITGDILDSNGNELLGFTTTGAAVNEINVTNAATGTDPVISATGDDANINIGLTPKGTGDVVLSSGADLVLNNAQNLNITAASQTVGAGTLTIPDLASTSQQVITENTTQTMTNKTLTNPVIAQVNDTNGNEILLLPATGSAVNEVTITNAATGSGPVISATGDDTNIDISLTPKGTGKVCLTNDAVVSGNLLVQGTTTAVDSTVINAGDNNILLQSGYTATSASAGGITVNYLATATTDTVAATGFTAGVASTSNPTVNTTGAATFTAGDIILITGANSVGNNGIFEVDSHAANVLTIRGIGTTSTTFNFLTNQFTTDTAVAGTITQVNVAVLQAADGSGTTSAGDFEVAKGSSTTGMTFTALAAGDPVGNWTEATVSTTDATLTQIATIATTSDTSNYVEVRISAVETDDHDETLCGRINAAYLNDGGTLAQVSIDDILFFRTGAATWSVDTAVDGTSVDINVQGAAATNINWKVQYRNLSYT
jgi:hypothetical protein